MRTVITALVLLVFTPSPLISQQQIDTATKEDVQQTLALTGVRTQIRSMWNALAQSRAKLEAADYQQKNPKASPAEVEKVELASRQRFEEAIKSYDMDELIDAIVPVYQRYFTHSDLRTINDFYGSPVGQKMLKNSSDMMMEGMQAVQPIIQRHLAECQAAAEKAAGAAVQSGERANPGDAAGTANASMTDETQRLRISPEISEGLLISQVPPLYPPLARQARIQGTVVLEGRIGKDGTVESLTVVSGHPMLIPSAMDAVKQWRYTPYRLNGIPVLVLTRINVNFKLQ